MGMIRERWGLGLIAVSALGTIAVSMSFLSSRYPDVREEATIALVLAIIAGGGALWMSARRSRAKNPN
jgi:hypothetical protein